MIRPSLRCCRGLAAPRSGPGPGYYDMLAGDIWRSPSAGQQARGDAPGGPSAMGHHNAS
jgi:hypothetical protein